jgi:hypothetical protein
MPATQYNEYVKTYVVPEGRHEQNLIKHIDETINMIGGFVEQTNMDGKYSYEVDSNKRFRVRDLSGKGMVFRVIRDRYKLEPINVDAS